jgi:RHS repeat-associated protein
LNQRIKKTVGSTLTKSFFNENWQELESVTNNQVTSYVWGLRYIDDLVLREKSEERLYSFADPNWNVVGICNESGTIQERYTYDAFGKRNIFDDNFVIKTDSDFVWNRAFTGQVFDNETGLILYRNRYFNTLLGRFVSRDPIGYEDDPYNLYRYVVNQSPNHIDPDGYARDSVSTTIIRSVTTGDIQILQTLLDSGGLSAEQAAAVVAAIAAIELAKEIERCKRKGCLPCNPPAGAIAYSVNPVPPSKPHKPILGTHTHHFKMNQSPYPICGCGWTRDVVPPTPGVSPQPGEILVTPATGGGPVP